MVGLSVWVLDLGLLSCLKCRVCARVGFSGFGICVAGWWGLYWLTYGCCRLV